MKMVSAFSARRLLLAAMMPAAFGSLAARADDSADLPGNGFPAARYEVLWTKSPFSVASPDGSAVESPDYDLVGIAEFDGVSYASIIDKKSQEHFLVSSGTPAHGLTLISITRGKDAGGTSALLQRNGEALTLKLDTTPAQGLGNPGGVAMPMMSLPNAAANQQPGSAAEPAPPPVALRARMIRLPPRGPN